MAIEILLYRDATIRLPLKELVEGLNQVFKYCHASLGRELVEIPGAVVSLASYAHLPKPFIQESATADVVLIATEKRYDNNFFYHYRRNVAIISFASWELLTKLPAANGLLLMLAEFSRGLNQTGEESRRLKRMCE